MCIKHVKLGYMTNVSSAVSKIDSVYILHRYIYIMQYKMGVQYEGYLECI